MRILSAPDSASLQAYPARRTRHRTDVHGKAHPEDDNKLLTSLAVDAVLIGTVFPVSGQINGNFGHFGPFLIP